MRGRLQIGQHRVKAEPTTCTIGGINFERHETGQAIVGVAVAADQPLVLGIRELQMT